jgi:anti-sigma regulatory factor (Ser/Thr protein kinase)
MLLEACRDKRIHVIAVGDPEELRAAEVAISALPRDSNTLVLLDLEELKSAPPEILDLLSECAREAKGNRIVLNILAKKTDLRKKLRTDVFESLFETFPFQTSFRAVLRREFSYAHPVRFPLDLPCRYRYLSEMRYFFYEIIRSRFEESDSFKVGLIVDELCLNAIDNTIEESPFTVDWFLGDGKFHATVSNSCQRRSASLKRMRKLLDNFDDSGSYLEDRGRGLYLVKGISDWISFDPGKEDPDKISVSIEKKLKPR